MRMRKLPDGKFGLAMPTMSIRDRTFSFSDLRRNRAQPRRYVIEGDAQMAIQYLDHLQAITAAANEHNKELLRPRSKQRHQAPVACDTLRRAEPRFLQGPE